MNKELGQKNDQEELLQIKSQYTEFKLASINHNDHIAAALKEELVKLISASRIPKKQICEYLGVPRRNYYRWKWQLQNEGSITRRNKHANRPKQYEIDEVKAAIFKVLHAPPSKYKINRTTWTYAHLQASILTEGYKVSQHTIRKVIRDAGYRWLKAKKVLTSNDPNYRKKLDKIHVVLGELKPNEGFFSIDEYGPFAVKHREGKKLIPKGQSFTVPQWQQSKGFLIITAALELSTNQVTHFYSIKKDTEEMIKLLDILLKEYSHLKRIFLSWDAASWHTSKELKKVIKVNNQKVTPENGTKVQLIPLPAGAQFLNVIESVFSGMARAIIHNSNYESVDHAKKAIDLYFADRNEHFRKNPKKAGKKIWGKERTNSEFSEGQNCKDPKYR